MLTLIPVFTLIFSAILIQVFGRWVLSTGRTWLISGIISLVVWVSMIIIRLIMPAGLTIENWLPGNTGVESIVLQFSADTWVLGFLLVSLLVAVVFIEAKNLEQGDHINILSGSMFLTAFGLTAILAGSRLTFLLVWVIIDLVEFSFLVGVISDGKTHNNAVSALLVRLLGIILMLLIVSIQNPTTSNIGTGNGKVIAGVLILFVALLRSGIIPIHLPYTMKVHFRRGIGTILRLIPPLSVMAFLINVGPQEFSTAQSRFIHVILILGVFYGAISWLFSRDELSGRPYWIISIISLVLLSFIRQTPDAIIGLAILMVSCGSALFLYSPRFKLINAYFPLVLLGMLMLPFSPTTNIKQVLWGDTFKFVNLLLIPSMIILLGGVIRHAYRREDSTNPIENWVYFFYVAALIILLITPWVSEIFNIDRVSGGKYWWISIITILLLVIIFTIDFLRQRKKIKIPVQTSTIKRTLGPAILIVDKFLQFSWLGRFVKTIGSIVSSGIIIFVRVLEGDSGILWSFLFLVLLASVILTRLVP